MARVWLAVLLIAVVAHAKIGKVRQMAAKVKEMNPGEQHAVVLDTPELIDQIHPSRALYARC